MYYYFEILIYIADEVKEAGDTSILNMDNRQYNFDSSFDQLDSAELVDFETALSEHLSSGLSISDFITVWYITNLFIIWQYLLNE